MSNFEPEFEIKSMGHVTAEFKGPKTSENIAQLFEWFKREKWRGCWQINFPGNGGVNSIVFAETPKRLVIEETELPY